MVIGKGSETELLSENEVRDLVSQALSGIETEGKSVLVIIPDGTRTAPLGLFFRLFHTFMGGQAAKLDYLVALGTHQPLSEERLNRLVGITAQERRGQYARINIFNHRWDQPGVLQTIGTITAEEAHRLSGGLTAEELPVSLNRMVFDYDQLVICGPTFPHEVVGFSGGNKYLFPGIAGPETINPFHWLGALITSMKIIGVKDTPVRRVIDRAAAFVNVPVLCFSLVVRGEGLAGLFIGPPQEAYSKAADLSARLHIVYVERPFQRVLSMAPPMYDDLWTAAKAMYKLEPAIQDGGEVIVYAPHITEVSYTYGHLIDRIGYHVRDYFVAQMDRFAGIPGGVMAHSTHLKGAGTYQNGVEKPRIQVTLATGIPPERCRRINLGYLDPESIDVSQWEGREAEGILVVRKAGETLYRLKDG
jgi:nickel-dependent lactate racemase